MLYPIWDEKLISRMISTEQIIVVERAEDAYPLVSVLMTAFNRQEYISSSIESILASSYKNFELIICDDASTDNTFAIASSYEKKDNRIKVFKNEVNLGQFGNRNMAASYAKGIYLKYADSDDIIYPFMLKVMVEGMILFPEAALGFCLTFGPCKKPLPYLIDPESVYKQHFLEGGLLFVGPSGIIVRRDAFEQVKGFEEFGMPSDNHFSLKIAAKFPIVAMGRDLFWWRIHDSQVFIQNKNNYDNVLNNYNFSKDLIENYSPLNKSLNHQLLHNQKKIFYKNLLHISFMKFKPLIALALLKKMNFKSRILNIKVRHIQ